MTTQTWQIDSAHSGIYFSVKHLMIPKVRGQFGRWTGTISAQDGDFTQATVEVTIDAMSIDTGVADRDDHLKSADFFDKILFTGGTGMVGGLALRDCLRRAEVSEVTSIGRRRTGLEDSKLTEVVHQDFTDFGPIAASFEHRDVALFCLGAYTGAVADRELRTIVVDYAVAFADALRAGSPEVPIVSSAGRGADPTGHSRIAFARYKGRGRRLSSRGASPGSTSSAPGCIYPVEPRRGPNSAIGSSTGSIPS